MVVELGCTRVNYVCFIKARREERPGAQRNIRPERCSLCTELLAGLENSWHFSKEEAATPGSLSRHVHPLCLRGEPAPSPPVCGRVTGKTNKTLHFCRKSTADGDYETLSQQLETGREFPTAISLPKDLRVPSCPVPACLPSFRAGVRASHMPFLPTAQGDPAVSQLVLTDVSSKEDIKT